MSLQPVSSTPEATEKLPLLRFGMIGVGMIFEETYLPYFQAARKAGCYDRAVGAWEVELTALASRTGSRAEEHRKRLSAELGPMTGFHEPDAVGQLLAQPVDAVCVATPDDRHFGPCEQILAAGKHLLVEKPSVLSLQELDRLVSLAQQQQVLAKVVYHKLFDPDHKKLCTLVADGVFQHVNSGYCTLLEPKQISGSQFAEWISGRNPGTYVAVHYIKLIDFCFGGRLLRVTCTGQRGLIGSAAGATWDSTQLRLVYGDESGREAAFDIHTSWVTPDNFPGYVDQEVQFRFDNGLWNAHSRRRGVECTVEAQTPNTRKIHLNNHYNGSFREPWGERTIRGYGLEAIERFGSEVAYVEYGGPSDQRPARVARMQELAYNDLSADRQVVAAVQAMEAILRRHAAGDADCVVRVNDPAGGLVLFAPGSSQPEVLYQPLV